MILSLPLTSSSCEHHQAQTMTTLAGLPQYKTRIRRRVKVGEKTGVELRYYTMKEYNKLSHEEKKELAFMRRDCDKPDDDHNQTVSALKQQVEDLESRLITAIKTKTDGDKEEAAKHKPLANPLNQRS